MSGLNLSSPDSDGMIYYISSAEMKRVKIGYTKNGPKKRLKALQTGSPTKLSILAIHPGTVPLEREIHGFLARSRTHGEWFDMTDEVLNHLASVYVWRVRYAMDHGHVLPEWALQGIHSMLEIGVAPQWLKDLMG